MRSEATTVEEYLTSLPPDREAALRALRVVVLAHLPDGYEEVMSYGMISYVVPFSRLAETYNGQPLTYLSLASQKRHMALYLMGVYGSAHETTFREAWTASGHELDMGKSCVRFIRLDQLPLDVIAEEVGRLGVDDFVAVYEDARASSSRKR